MKTLTRILRRSAPHWVGNGFPVQSIFDYNSVGRELSPFLLLDYAAPHPFPPGQERRGVGSGPFVMNTESEIRQAIKEFQNGRLG